MLTPFLDDTQVQTEDCTHMVDWHFICAEPCSALLLPQGVCGAQTLARVMGLRVGNDRRNEKGGTLARMVNGAPGKW